MLEDITIEEQMEMMLNVVPGFLDKMYDFYSTDYINMMKSATKKTGPKITTPDFKYLFDRVCRSDEDDHGFTRSDIDKLKETFVSLFLKPDHGGLENKCGSYFSKETDGFEVQRFKEIHDIRFVLKGGLKTINRYKYEKHTTFDIKKYFNDILLSEDTHKDMCRSHLEDCIPKIEIKSHGYPFSKTISPFGDAEACNNYAHDLITGGYNNITDSKSKYINRPDYMNRMEYMNSIEIDVDSTLDCFGSVKTKTLLVSYIQLVKEYESNLGELEIFTKELSSVILSLACPFSHMKLSYGDVKSARLDVVLRLLMSCEMLRANVVYFDEIYNYMSTTAKSDISKKFLDLLNKNEKKFKNESYNMILTSMIQTYCIWTDQVSDETTRDMISFIIDAVNKFTKSDFKNIISTLKVSSLTPSDPISSQDYYSTYYSNVNYNIGRILHYVYNNTSNIKTRMSNFITTGDSYSSSINMNEASKDILASNFNMTSFLRYILDTIHSLHSTTYNSLYIKYGYNKEGIPQFGNVTTLVNRVLQRIHSTSLKERLSYLGDYTTCEIIREKIKNDFQDQDLSEKIYFSRNMLGYENLFPKDHDLLLFGVEDDEEFANRYKYLIMNLDSITNLLSAEVALLIRLFDITSARQDIINISDEVELQKKYGELVRDIYLSLSRVNKKISNISDILNTNSYFYNGGVKDHASDMNTNDMYSTNDLLVDDLLISSRSEHYKDSLNNKLTMIWRVTSAMLDSLVSNDIRTLSSILDIKHKSLINVSANQSGIDQNRYSILPASHEDEAYRKSVYNYFTRENKTEIENAILDTSFSSDRCDNIVKLYAVETYMDYAREYYKMNPEKITTLEAKYSDIIKKFAATEYINYDALRNDIDEINNLEIYKYMKDVSKMIDKYITDKDILVENSMDKDKYYLYSCGYKVFDNPKKNNILKNIISKITKSKYTHVSIFLDKGGMSSVDMDAPGLVIKHPDSIRTRSGITYDYDVFGIELTKEEYINARKIFSSLLVNKDKYSYDLKNLIRCLFDKTKDPQTGAPLSKVKVDENEAGKEYFICSAFAYNILEKIINLDLSEELFNSKLINTRITPGAYLTLPIQKLLFEVKSNDTLLKSVSIYESKNNNLPN